MPLSETVPRAHGLVLRLTGMLVISLESKKPAIWYLLLGEPKTLAMAKMLIENSLSHVQQLADSSIWTTRRRGWKESRN